MNNMLCLVIKCMVVAVILVTQSSMENIKESNNA